MNNYVIYLKLKSYLAQWFIHSHGGTNPVHLPRNSAESDILEAFLTCAPIGKRVGEISPSDSNVAIVIPSFRFKNPKSYNYLPPKAMKALENAIFVKFKIEMWKELHDFAKSEIQITDLIYAFMEKHGIEDDAKNWETIRQMYYRKRNICG